MLLHLLDEISCLIFFLYTAIFRGGEFDLWLHALIGVAMVFIIFNRRNYDKATLCQLRDLLFHFTDNPDVAHNFQNHFEVFTEKIEILQSVEGSNFLFLTFIILDVHTSDSSTSNDQHDCPCLKWQTT